MTGSFGVTDFTEEEGRKVAPKTVVLNDLIGVLISRTEDEKK
jgi:hypothetical protein